MHGLQHNVLRKRLFGRLQVFLVDSVLYLCIDSAVEEYVAMMKMLLEFIKVNVLGYVLGIRSIGSVLWRLL